MMDLQERPRKVRQHQPGANHYDTTGRDRMAAANPTSTTPERWLPIPGYEGHYEVSDHGRVRSLDRTIDTKRGKYRLRGRMLKQSRVAINYNGRKVNLLKNGSQKTIRVHRLVLEAFVGPCPDGMEVCHDNGDPSDNRLENLRYDTTSENHRDSVKHGTHYQAKKSHCPQGHEYFPENLAPWVLKTGRRRCLACVRAESHTNKHPELKSCFDEIADQYYAAILKQAGWTA